MKTILQIILIAAVVALGYWIYIIFKTPIEFESQREQREAAVIERLKDIRTIQRFYRNENGKFAGSFQDLFNFYHNDSIKVVLAVGSEDDSSAMDKLVRIESLVSIKDTLFHTRSGFKIEDIEYVPFSAEATGSKVAFQMDTATLVTESEVVVPVFQAYAAYPSFLGDLDKQELINYRDERVNTLGREDGLKVGSVEAANNEAGNWE